MRLTCVVVAVMLVAGSAGGLRSAAPTSAPAGTLALLDRYERGEHEAVFAELVRAGDATAVLKDLQSSGSAWIQARGSAEVRRRQLVAASFALEAAVPHLWPEDVDPLVEWGCELMRKRGSAADAPEHLWQLASVAIFGRARDDGRLVTRAGPGAPLGSHVPPPRRAIDHIAHAEQRIPEEPRFRLAEAMLAATLADTEPPRDAPWISTAQLPRNSDGAMRRARAAQAIQLFEPLIEVPALRAEAEVRLGYLKLVLHEFEASLDHFAQARGTDDVFVAYLARFLSGRALDALNRRDDANAMYRSALEVVPHAQSASEALAANLFLAGAAGDAYAAAQDALSGDPRRGDPWHEFGYGDRRFIPARMSALREALK